MTATEHRDDVFRTVVVPVASEDDARMTCAATRPYLGDGRVVVLHVIEKAGGAPDKASVEQREEVADEIFAVARECFGETDVDVETRVAFGTDVADVIREVAADEDASSIVFTPRRDSRWLKLLSGDVANSLVNEADRPVVVLPEVDG